MQSIPVLFSFLLIGTTSGRVLYVDNVCAGSVHVEVSATQSGGTTEKYCPTQITQNFAEHAILLHHNFNSELDGYTPPEFIGSAYLQGEHFNRHKQKVTLKLNAAQDTSAKVNVFVFLNNGTGFELNGKTNDWTGNLGAALPSLGFEKVVGGGPPYDNSYYVRGRGCKWPACHGLQSEMWSHVLTNNEELTIPINDYENYPSKVHSDENCDMHAVYGIIVQGACRVFAANAKEGCPESISIQ